MFFATVFSLRTRRRRIAKNRPTALHRPVQTIFFAATPTTNDMIPDSALPKVHGYDEYGAFNCAGEQLPVHEDVRHTLAFIQKSVAAKTPFFVNLWIQEPHTPFHTVPKYEWRFRGMESREDQIYASVLSHADDRIGEGLAALDRLKLSEDTLVVFSSDNGPARGSNDAKLDLQYDTGTGAVWGIAASKGLTAGRKGFKAALFEGGINVPFIARWPGKIPAGKLDNSPSISAVDLLPTFCELAGATPPDGYQPDGISQVEACKGKATATRPKPLFWKMGGGKDSEFHRANFAVVDRQWKLLTTADGKRVELYDIVADTLETKDVAAERPEVVQQLGAQLKAWRATLPKMPSGEVFSAERST
jgi:arylsulfatase A-like enzyme